MQAMGTDCSWYKDGKVDGEALKAAYPDDYKVQYSEVNLDDFKAYLKTTYPDLYKAAATDKSGQKNALTNFASNRKTTLNKTDLNALYTEFMEKNGALDPKDKAPAAIDNMLEIIAGEMSAEDRDNAIYGNLAQHKDESAAAASASAAAASLSASALKSGSQKATSDKSAKAVTAIDGCIQALAKIKDSYAKAASAATTETEDAAASAKTYEDVRRYSISDEELLIDSKTLDAIEKEASDEGALMEIPVKVALSNKGKLTLKYTDEASGKDWKTDETDFAVSFKYDSVKTLSILGFVAFPNDYTEFTSGTLEYKIKNYFINDVVLVPILLLLLCVAGAVLAIVFRDSFASGICPAAAGIVGLIAYLSSSFLKLGMKGARTTHIIICVLLLIAGCLQLYLGIEEKRKAAKNA